MLLMLLLLLLLLLVCVCVVVVGLLLLYCSDSDLAFSAARVAVAAAEHEEELGMVEAVAETNAGCLCAGNFFSISFIRSSYARNFRSNSFFDFVRRFHSFFVFVPRPRRLVHQLILLIKYSFFFLLFFFSSKYISCVFSRKAFNCRRSDSAYTRVVSRPFSTPTSNSFFLLGLVHSSKKKKKKKKGNC